MVKQQLMQLYGLGDKWVHWFEQLQATVQVWLCGLQHAGGLFHALLDPSDDDLQDKADPDEEGNDERQDGQAELSA